MAQKTRNKAHFDDVIVYDTLGLLDFDAVTPGGAIANSVINSRIVLPCAFKIIAVAIVQGAGANLLTAFNVIMGVAADATPSNPIGTNDPSDSGTTGFTVATNGTALFAADQAITAVADVPQTFFPVNFDVIYPQNAQLTLRIVTAGAGGPIKASLLGKPYDVNPTKPRSTSLLPSTDI